MEKDNLAVSCIRSLVIDTINKANSGHPGMSLDAAPILYTLFTKHLVANPKDPKWINRDRFVLSAGHASSLLYTMLHLAGYAISLDDLKQFRQLHSLTPGHPECDVTPGVDATSGPLGQGIAQAVGMAISEEFLRNHYVEGSEVYNHYTYCLCGDGCLQEGISQEAISFAGLHKLNKLILIYDCNDVTLDGPLSNSFTENVVNRFKASNWNTIEVKDGNNIDEIDRAIRKAKKSQDKPTLIKVNTIIGYGSANQGTCKVHGAPLGSEDGKHAKEVYDYKYDEFTVLDEVYQIFKDTFAKRGLREYRKWKKRFKAYTQNHAAEAEAIKSFQNNSVKSSIDPEKLLPFAEGTSDSTRNESQIILNNLNKQIPVLIGGSADVAKSVMTMIKDETDFTPENRTGRNMNFGIREFAMAAVTNGMLLHGGLRTYCGCFLVFADYMKPAVRMSALSKIPAIFLFSHDSIAVGEDGPTHQPIEQLAMLRSIPNLLVFRPCDGNELNAAYRIALENTETPSALILSRQKLPNLGTTNYEGVSKGAYIVSKEQNKLDLTLISTGSEVSLCLEVQKLLLEEGIDVRVVSMPSQELFNRTSKKYQTEVLGKDYSKRLSVEMLSSFGWNKYAKHTYSIDTFGASAKDKDVMKYFNFTPEALKEFVKNIISENK